MFIEKKRQKGKAEKRAEALFEIAIIILSTIAFTYLIAMTIPSVSAVLTPGQCVKVGGITIFRLNSDGSVSIPNSVNGYPNVYSFCVSNSNLCSCTGASGTNCQITAPAVDCPAAPTQSSTQPSTLPNPVAAGQGIFQASQLYQQLMNLGKNNLANPGTGGAAGGAAGGAGSASGGAGAGQAGAQAAAQQEAAKLTFGYILKNAAIATALYFVTDFAAKQVGLNQETAHAASLGVSIGYFAESIASKIATKTLVGKIIGFVGGPVPFGIAVGVLVFLFTWSSTKTQSYAFTCYPWQAPTGGANCAKCNSGDIACTEYRCKSLGQGCSFIDNLCVWNNSRDVTPPVITPWTDILTTGYKYIPDNTISPPDNGVKIVPLSNNSGCLNASSPITFGITLNKPGICKIDTVNTANFSAMQYYFGGSSSMKYNHSQTLTLPDVNALAAENITIENGNNFMMYTKCQDANGNTNGANFVFKFCVDQSPDTTAPLIETTSIINGSPIAFNTSTVNISVYVQDQNTVSCRWSKTDKDYNSMENNMSCPGSVTDVNTQGLYQCKTTLTGLLSSQSNQFYFKCQDNSPQKNVDSTSYDYVLQGTQRLDITSIGPNATIMNASSVIKATLTATTFAGADNGNAQCYFSNTGNPGSYVLFYYPPGTTYTYQHSQDLYLVPGNYKYYIQCIDLGGNTATNMTSFTVQSDTTPPIVVRAYNSNGNLNIATDENATCVYSTNDQIGCTYDFTDGTQMQSSQNQGNLNYISWDPTKTFYIKCMDSFANQPAPDECSIIASPYSVSNSSQ